MKKLNVNGGTYIYLVATYGTTPGCCSEDIRRILKKRGLMLSASFGVKMQDTWTPIFALSDTAEVEKQKKTAEEYIDNAIRKIREKETGNHAEHRTPYAVRLVTDPLLNVERKTKNLHVEDRCIGCGLCAKKCPVQAIEIRDKKPVWVKNQCTICLRCFHPCPKFAIQSGSGKTKKHGQYRNPHVRT